MTEETLAVPEKSSGPAAAILIGGVMITIGTLMPWLIAWQPATGTITQNGIGNGAGDGIVTLPLGILLAILGIVCLSGSRPPKLVVTIPAVIVLVVGWIDYQYLNAKVANQLMTGYSMQIGIGIYVVLAGAIAAIAGGARAHSTKKKEDASDADRA
jgi:hypothetical protein